MKVGELRYIVEDILRLLFPNKCAVCGEVLKDGAVCDKCFKKIRFMHGNIENDIFAAAFEYDDISSKLIYKFKFRGRKYIADTLCGYMEKRFYECFSDMPFSCITYVPMSKGAKRRRGFNQAELLAQKLSERLAIPCEDMLKKVKKNRPQHTLPEKERITNVRGVYKATNNTSCIGRHVLLIDDVITTGSTVRECRAELLRAGAASVTVLCAAKTPRYEQRRYG